MSRDEEAAHFTTWLREAAEEDKPIGDLVADMNDDDGARGRDFTATELYEYLQSVGASWAAIEVLIRAAKMSGYPLDLEEEP